MFRNRNTGKGLEDHPPENIATSRPYNDPSDSVDFTHLNPFAHYTEEFASASSDPTGFSDDFTRMQAGGNRANQPDQIPQSYEHEGVQPPAQPSEGEEKVNYHLLFTQERLDGCRAGWVKLTQKHQEEATRLESDDLYQDKDGHLPDNWRDLQSLELVEMQKWHVRERQAHVAAWDPIPGQSVSEVADGILRREIKKSRTQLRNEKQWKTIDKVLIKETSKKYSQLENYILLIREGKTMRQHRETNRIRRGTSIKEMTDNMYRQETGMNRAEVVRYGRSKGMTERLARKELREKRQRGEPINR